MRKSIGSKEVSRLGNGKYQLIWRNQNSSEGHLIGRDYHVSQCPGRLGHRLKRQSYVNDDSEAKNLEVVGEGMKLLVMEGSQW